MKALKTKIRGLDKSQFKRLKELTAHAKNLYNQTLWTLRQAFETTGLYFPYPKMDKVISPVKNLEGKINYKLLKAKVSQQTLRRLDKNFKSFFKCHQDYQKNSGKYFGSPKSPRFKHKQYDNLIYDYQAFQVKGPLVVLEKGLSFLLPKKLRGKKIKQVEIVPKYQYFEAIFVYEDDEIKETVSPSDKVMAIDLGLNNLATCVTNGAAKPFIVDGRRLKSINHHYNKRLAKLQSHLKKTRLRSWSNRLQRLTDRRNARIGDYLHKATRQITDICVLHGISKVVVGDVSKSLNQINLGKKTNQNFVNLSLGQFIDKLRYKLELHRITLEVTNESYTSKASFIDADSLPKKYEPLMSHSFSGKRIKRGLYRSQNGTALNADANGAYNILRKSNPKFSFSELTKKVGEGISDWLHPYTRLKIC
ncbi:transposase [Candidatus Parabeggiatoa sp. HSG14]|uniref:RNA-guided endonuclease InsQ/TnpB family protein n=1 Tax=Candidatus Parabeggiatoa sp. HSG14 TaxID=3055593 RepID=UPI0025A8324A|nr:transposase [Thiotrichales bacterium HSG14]